MPIDCPVKTTPGFWFMGAVMALLLPLQWVTAILISSLIHELGHVIAAQLTGARIRCIRLCASGAYLETEPMTPQQQFICALAGPLGALTLIPMSAWMPRTCLCVIVQSCYHLLPIFPNDGGRALQSWTQYVGNRYGIYLCRTAEILTLVLIIFIGLYMSTCLRLGLLPVGICAAMIFRCCREKYLANRSGKGYNISSIL